MIAYKFLGLGAVGLFSGFAWPTPDASAPGPEVDAGAVDPCRRGIHACRAPDLLEWIDDELWLVELGGEVVDAMGMLVAPRGRLVARVGAWDAAAADGFARACADRARARAVEHLRVAGHEADARALSALDDLGAVRDLARRLAARAGSEACAFAADAAALSLGARPDADAAPPAHMAPTPGAVAANLGYVVAHAAGVLAGAPRYDEAYRAERGAQLAWLSARLDMSFAAGH